MALWLFAQAKNAIVTVAAVNMLAIYSNNVKRGTHNEQRTQS